MKYAEIEEFAKQKKKEHRIKIDKIKETARQQNQERQDKFRNRVLLERYLYDARNCDK